MAWGKICGSIAFHRKTVAAGNEAMGVWVRMLGWTCENGTDGFVPESITGIMSSDPAPLDALVSAGWLERVSGGYVMRNHLKYNMSREQSEALRTERRAAGSRGGVAKAVAFATAIANASAVANEVAKLYPTPTPTPTPTPSQNPSPEADPPDDAPAAKQAIEMVEERYRGYGHTIRPTARSPHRAHIRARVREGWSAEDLASAVDGNHRDKWHAEKSKHELEYVFRNSEQVSKFVDLAKAAGAPPIDTDREMKLSRLEKILQDSKIMKIGDGR